MAESGTESVVCSRCGKDCSQGRRAKDAKGRPVCGACVDKAKAAGGAKPAPDANADFMSKLIADSPRLTQPACPQCGDPFPAASIICTHCGYNRETGKNLRTRFGTIAAPKEKNEPKKK